MSPSPSGEGLSLSDDLRCRYKVVIAYDGTDFHGWQFQGREATVCQTLQDKFFEVFGERVSIVGASRTDAGVHAKEQVASFKSALKIDLEKIKRAWSGALPQSIVLRSLEAAKDGFHPQFGVAQKTYMYHVSLKRPLPFISRYVHHFKFDVDIEKLKNALSIFVGKHDFSAFCKSPDPDRGAVRSVDSVHVSHLKKFGVIRITIRGRSFLRYMIRRMVGAAFEVASRKSLSLNYLQEVLDAKNPEHTLPNFPAKGLLLRKIVYEG